MLIDCDRCQMRGIACADCVVEALMTDRNEPSAGHAAPRDMGTAPAHTDGAPARTDGAPVHTGGALPHTGPVHTGCAAAHTGGAPGPEIGEPERRALRTLASAGLIPPLRLVLAEPEHGPEHRAARGDQPAAFPDAEAS